MITNKFSSASSLLTGIFFIILGALFFTEYSKIWALIYILFMIGFLWIGLNQILRALNNKQNARPEPAESFDQSVMRRSGDLHLFQSRPVLQVYPLRHRLVGFTERRDSVY